MLPASTCKHLMHYIGCRGREIDLMASILAEHHFLHETFSLPGWRLSNL